MGRQSGAAGLQVLNGRASEGQASSTPEGPQHMGQEGKGMTSVGTEGSMGPAHRASPCSEERSPVDGH